MLKKGQIFLIAALIISGITIGFGTIYNEASVERQDAAVYDLSTELRSELQQVYDNGVINSKDEDKIKEDITKLALYYSEQNPDSNFEIFFGNETDIYYLSLDQINPKNADVEKLHVSSSEEGDADSPNLFRQNPSATVQPGQVTLCLTPEQRGIEGEETDNKRISEMVAYTLLIIIAVGISVLVYTYLQVLVPKDKATCPDTISATILNVSCSINEINVTVYNKGLFTIDALYLRLGSKDKKVKPLINSESVEIGQNGLAPGQSTILKIPLNTGIAIVGENSLELQPAVRSRDRFSLCDNAVITRTLECR